MVELDELDDHLARSRRAHFARRLLDDSELPIIEVAHASGFGSLRQFNRAMRESFRSSPSELRGRRRRADRLATDGGLTLRLPFQPPLDWHATTAYLAARAIPGVESAEPGSYRRTIVLDGDPGMLEIAPGGGDHLLLRAHLPHMAPPASASRSAWSQGWSQFIVVRACSRGRECGSRSGPHDYSRSNFVLVLVLNAAGPVYAATLTASVTLLAVRVDDLGASLPHRRG